MLERHPDRFLYGSDEVAPANRSMYLRVFEQYAPLWKALRPETLVKVRRNNYERIFDQARQKVRRWERLNLETTVAAQ